MQISKETQNLLNKYVPKEDQDKFVDSAINTKISGIIPKKINDFMELFVDGGSRGNPGEAGGGYVVFKNGKEIMRGHEYFGFKTNNQSEYLDLRTALRAIYAKYPESGIHCFMDSKLVVEQLNGNWKVKNENMRVLFNEIKSILEYFKDFKIEHIRREQNKIADALANKAMDEA